MSFAYYEKTTFVYLFLSSSIIIAQQPLTISHVQEYSRILIKQKDAGNGADYDEIIKEINKTNAEQILQAMIKTGEIFNTSPTRIKVLE